VELTQANVNKMCLSTVRSILVDVEVALQKGDSEMAEHLLKEAMETQQKLINWWREDRQKQEGVL